MLLQRIEQQDSPGCRRWRTAYAWIIAGGQVGGNPQLIPCVGGLNVRWDGVGWPRYSPKVGGRGQGVFASFGPAGHARASGAVPQSREGRSRCSGGSRGSAGRSPRVFDQDVFVTVTSSEGVSSVLSGSGV